jgi:hypothetical protein
MPLKQDGRAHAEPPSPRRPSSDDVQSSRLPTSGASIATLDG